MKLKVNYNELRTGIRTYLPTKAINVPDIGIPADYDNAYVNDDETINTMCRGFAEGQFGKFRANYARVINMMIPMLDYDFEYRSVYAALEEFREYYMRLAKEAEKYDGKKTHVSLEKALKKNLSLGALGAASKNYRGLMKLYGKKKANSILKKAKKETGAKVVVKKKFVKEQFYKYYEIHNKCSIVAKKEKGSSKGSGASTGAKKTKKSKTKTVKKKKK